MQIKPIRTQHDHAAALRNIEALMDAKPTSPDGDKLDARVTLVEAHEAKRTPLLPARLSP